MAGGEPASATGENHIDVVDQACALLLPEQAHPQPEPELGLRAELVPAPPAEARPRGARTLPSLVPAAPVADLPGSLVAKEDSKPEPDEPRSQMTLARTLRDELTTGDLREAGSLNVSLTPSEAARTVQIARIPVEAASDRKVRALLRGAGCAEPVLITLCPDSEHKQKVRETGLTWALATFGTIAETQAVMGANLGPTGTPHYKMRNVDLHVLGAKSGGTIGRVAKVTRPAVYVVSRRS